MLVLLGLLLGIPTGYFWGKIDGYLEGRASGYRDSEAGWQAVVERHTGGGR